MKLCWSDLPRPIIALSPMADMTDSAFCRTVRNVIRHDSIVSRPLIVFREMVSAEAVVRGNDKTLAMAAIHPDERPLVQQLFGNDPATMEEATRIIEDRHHPNGFDINMGCPVYKIVHTFNGAALMREPERAKKIVKAVKAATDLPVSIKIRAGWEHPSECIEFAKMLEDVGADLIALHGRTKAQGYSGASDWHLIREVKRGISIPLLANGDIHTPPLTLKALETTGADGVLIARGALGNPWIFPQIEDLLAGRETRAITLVERVRVIKQHLMYHIEQHGERGVVTFRKHLSWYFRGINGAKPYKERLHTAVSKEGVNEILNEMFIHGLINNGLSTRDALHRQSSERAFMKNVV